MHLTNTIEKKFNIPIKRNLLIIKLYYFQPWQSSGVTFLAAPLILSAIISFFKRGVLHTFPLIFDQNSSIGFKNDEYGGRNRAMWQLSWIAFMTSLVLCIEALSITIYILCKPSLFRVVVISSTSNKKCDEFVPCGNALFVPAIFFFFFLAPLDFGTC